MGIHQNISHDKFPKQSERVGKRTDVCFNYDTAFRFGAVIVRDDTDSPFETILRLDDGRFVRSVECMYTFV